MPDQRTSARNSRVASRIILPVLIVASCSFLAVLLINNKDRQLQQRQLAVASSQSAVALQDSLDNWNLALQALKSYWLGSDYVSLEEFETYSQTIAPYLHGLVALEWIDDQDVYRYAYPPTATNMSVINKDLHEYPNRLAVLQASKQTGQLQIAGPLQLIEGYPGIIMYQSIYKPSGYVGTVVGVIRLDDIFAPTDQFVKNREIYSAVVRTPAAVITSDGKSLYSLDGKKILDAKGTLDDKASFPFPSSQYRDEVSVVHAADETWYLHLYQPLNSTNNPWHVVAYGSAAILSFGCLIFLIILYRRDKQNRELEMRERDFVSLVSHQLKAPITELLWILDTMESAKTTVKQRASFLKDMRTIVQQCSKLMKDLLNVSRIERGVLHADLQEESLAEMMREVLLPLREIARSKKIRIINDIPPKLIVLADKVKLIEALRNIVDNSLKFSPAGSTIELFLKPDGQDHAIIAIQDHGSGIDPMVQKNLFEKATLFAPKGTGDGAGLGLYLTKQFIELMGGAIEYTTSSEGTTFFINLPRVR